MIALLLLKYLQLRASFGWSLSNLCALRRQQLFVYRDLFPWLNDPFQPPPLWPAGRIASSLSNGAPAKLDSTGANLLCPRSFPVLVRPVLTSPSAGIWLIWRAVVGDLRHVILTLMTSKIVARIAAQTGITRLLPALSEDIVLSDLQSLLMHVYQSRTATSNESDLRRGAERGLVAASKVDARVLGPLSTLRTSSRRLSSHR